MAESRVFETVCDELERTTCLNRLESRGTIRLALKQAGLDPRNVTASQMTVVLEKVLPAELQTRGVSDVDALLSRIVLALGDIEVETTHESPETVFERLGG
jgi:hypothetical protein